MTKKLTSEEISNIAFKIYDADRKSRQEVLKAFDYIDLIRALRIEFQRVKNLYVSAKSRAENLEDYCDDLSFRLGAYDENFG